MDCGIACYMPVDTTVLYLLLHPLADQPPSPFRTDVPLPPVKTAECSVREWVHEAEHLPSPIDANLTLVACQPGTIVAVRARFWGYCSGTWWWGASSCMVLRYAARGHPHCRPEYSSGLRMAGTIAQGGGVCLSLRIGVKMYIGSQ